jgi:hypothetical protein
MGAQHGVIDPRNIINFLHIMSKPSDQPAVFNGQHEMAPRKGALENDNNSQTEEFPI